MPRDGSWSRPRDRPYLIWTIDFMSQIDRDLAERVAARLIEWLPDVDPEEVRGFKWMLSGLRARHDDLHM